MIDLLFVFLLGACVGSFLNVCIYRIPAGRSLVQPGSTCACGHPVAWHDNVPILSWLLLRGRARCCGGHFSVRYPAIEMLTAALFLSLAVLFPWWKALIGMVFVSLIVCAVFIDTDHMIIPDGITIGGALVGLILVTVLPAINDGRLSEVPLLIRGATAALRNGLIASGFLFWIAATSAWLLKKESMGMGDVKLIGTIGVFLGWKAAIFSIFGGGILGLVWIGLAFGLQKIFGNRLPLGLKHGREDGSGELGLSSAVSFGPMIGSASVLYLLIDADRFVGF